MKKIAIAALIGLLVAADAGLVIAYLKRGGAAQAGKAPQTQEEPHALAQPGRAADSTLWAQLRAEGDDARAFAAKLRKAGVPDRMARLLVGEALHEEYLAKQRELVGRLGPEDRLIVDPPGAPIQVDPDQVGRGGQDGRANAQ